MPKAVKKQIIITINKDIKFKGNPNLNEVEQSALALYRAIGAELTDTVHKKEFLLQIILNVVTVLSGLSEQKKEKPNE